VRRLVSACLVCLFFYLSGSAQNGKNPVYVDAQGVMRWTDTKTEATFFGVNYTVPFAYGYRSHRALGVDLQKAIDADVYHMSRLGLNAFRVHVWDVEISDSLGNLLNNEHLKLFDYLIKKLKERNIKILITPIAFWGNGYPEKDEKTTGFATVYGKGNSVHQETPMRAQENYLKQFFKHVNPYTKLRYQDDPDVIAMEINNEPQHSGPKLRATEYVNRMATAVKSTGWTKPIFYNISESPNYADAIVRGDVVGHSFQWYPTGLVAGREIKGNLLPHVDKYTIPFGDTIPAFNQRAKMVYEFDAGDVMQPIMYPAMARSFRTAGFQWATQFAYDPMYTAYANTEYQTHFLNLAYTPAKAISLLIAGQVFHNVPRLKSYGTYPADTVFESFKLSYSQQLSEMNTETKFYHTNSTSSIPKNINRLQQIAGVGNSNVVSYSGTGAYFLDRLADGVWRLEVMPDAIPISDPFAKASPSKEVTRIEWRSHTMNINLPDLGKNFTIREITKGKNAAALLNAIQPGVYILSRQKLNNKFYKEKANDEFFAPGKSKPTTLVIHSPFYEVSAGKKFRLSARVVSDSLQKINLELRSSTNRWKTVPMTAESPYNYSAEVPEEVLTPGVLDYRIIIQTSKGEQITFPGGHKGDPYAWDADRKDVYQSFVAAPDAGITLFDATRDRNAIVYYNPDWKRNFIEFTSGNRSDRLAVRTRMTNPASDDQPASKVRSVITRSKHSIGFQFFFREHVAARAADLGSYTKVVITARSKETVTGKITLITDQGQGFSAVISPSEEFKQYEIPLTSFKPNSALLLPRPYPGFLPLTYESPLKNILNARQLEKVEFSFGLQVSPGKEASIEIESVILIR
jgi:hypothetical protein